ncbi:Uncharacterised protein [uncultured archaeon]|nr:Uncharacterised protein [uncultured archaeon]
MLVNQPDPIQHKPGETPAPPETLQIDPVTKRILDALPDNREGIYDFGRDIRRYWRARTNQYPNRAQTIAELNRKATIHLDVEYRIDITPKAGIPPFRMFLAQGDQDLACINFTPFDTQKHQIRTADPQISWKAHRPMQEEERILLTKTAEAAAQKIARLLTGEATPARTSNPVFTQQDDDRLIQTAAETINPANTNDLINKAYDGNKGQPWTIPLQDGYTLKITRPADADTGDEHTAVWGGAGIMLEITDTNPTRTKGHETQVAYQTLNLGSAKTWEIHYTQTQTPYQQQGWSAFLTRTTMALAQTIANATQKKEAHLIQSYPTSPYTLARLTRLKWQLDNPQEQTEITRLLNDADQNPDQKDEIYAGILPATLSLHHTEFSRTGLLLPRKIPHEQEGNLMTWQTK